VVEIAAQNLIQVRRILLRELGEVDRAAFIRYQTDPKYLSLYDFGDDVERPSQLFDLFLNWRREQPRLNFQLGIFDSATGRLLGCGGLRKANDHSAVLGIELAPSEWGRFRVAIDAVAALLGHGFGPLGLETIFGDTANGNRRIEKLARWFGAEIVAQRDGPAWMQARGWQEVDWSLSRHEWEQAKDRLGRAL
jgi:ribosomal-protein-alanine N-acetyltransferase